MKQCIKVASLSLACAVALNAAGYKLPQQSLTSTALGAASVAAINGADANYYNPANMVWMDNAYHMEGSLTFVNLPKIKFDGTNAAHSGESKEENIFKPSLHVVTKEYYENWRFGFSMTAPGGLSKRWDSPHAKTYAEEFTLKIIEANPTAAYKVNDQFAIGFGLRGIYTDGVVKSDSGTGLSRDLTGDSIDYGYNLALAYRPTPDIKLAATYRSKVDLTVEGNAKLQSPLGGSYNGGASVTVPLPATLALAVAYTWEKTTAEFVYERTYWSAYKNLDFNYAKPFTNDVLDVLKDKFDDPKDKLWKDSNTYRLGITHEYSNKLTLMAGYAYDETPVPSSTLGFEQPDSDANIYSFGFAYKIRDDISVGLAYLYSDKKVRTVSHPDNDSVDGKFSNSGAHLLTTGITYRF